MISCSHAKQIPVGDRYSWCPRCGAININQTWHHPSAYQIVMGAYE